MESSIQLDGSIVWGLSMELSQGVRLRLSLDDWESLGFSTGQRVQSRISDRLDESLIVAELAPAARQTAYQVTNPKTSGKEDRGSFRLSGKRNSGVGGCAVLKPIPSRTSHYGQF